MPLLVDQSFADTFVFARGRTADYLDNAGETVTAAVDEPRLDHTPGGAPRGLLVEGRPQTGFADRCLARDGDWLAGLHQSTVLHDFETPAGEVRLRAWYAGGAGPLTILSSCLNQKGWHRQLTVIPGHLANRSGEVRWRDRFYRLGGLIAAAPGEVLATWNNNLLLEG